MSNCSGPFSHQATVDMCTVSSCKWGITSARSQPCPLMATSAMAIMTDRHCAVVHICMLLSPWYRQAIHTDPIRSSHTVRHHISDGIASSQGQQIFLQQDQAAAGVERASKRQSALCKSFVQYNCWSSHPYHNEITGSPSLTAHVCLNVSSSTLFEDASTSQCEPLETCAMNAAEAFVTCVARPTHPQRLCDAVLVAMPLRPHLTSPHLNCVDHESPFH